jgi:hypothetical protein
MIEMKRGLISCELRSEFIRDSLERPMGDATAIVMTLLATGLNKDQT